MTAANRRTQENQILWLLQASWPSWTPAPELSKLALQYGRAIHALRHKGWQIQNRTRLIGGARFGEFRLGTPPIPSSRELRKAATSIRMEPAEMESADKQDSLFGNLAVDRTYQE